MEAITQDDQVAEGLADQPEPARTPKRRLSEWTPVVELLTIIADRLAEQTQVVAASRGARPRQIPPLPRPGTAMERVRERRRQQRHRSLVARVLPGRSP